MFRSTATLLVTVPTVATIMTVLLPASRNCASAESAWSRERLNRAR